MSNAQMQIIVTGRDPRDLPEFSALREEQGQSTFSAGA